MPSSRSALPDRAFLTTQPFAHRGLHGPGRPENSRAAFAAAIAAGHGIELDVQPTRDHDAVVFHDATVDRLTNETGRLLDRPTRDVTRIRLAGVDETIPTLPDILALVARRVPVLIEVKAQGLHDAALCLSVFRALEGYTGPVGVMSFNPQIVHWFRVNAERVVRGLVVTQEGERGILARTRGAIARAAAMRRADPQFVALDIRDLPSRLSRAARSRGLPVLTWTVRSADDAARAAAHADQPIYEQR